MDEYHGTAEEVRQLQAEAMKKLKADIANTAASKDPVRYERKMFGSALAAARLRKKLSQADLAAKLGTSQPEISLIESGKGNPGLSTLLKLAKTLGVNLVLE